MVEAEIGLQIAFLLLTIGIFVSLYNLPRKALSKLRSSSRTNLQSNRHFLHGAQLLSRAGAARSSSSVQSLAKSALSEADQALSLNPRDPAAHILRALVLDLLGHKSSALRSLDTALSPPSSKSLSGRERGDALVKRAELQLAVNRRRRVDSAVSDLVEAVSLSGDNVKAHCLLGQCYEQKGIKEEAIKAFQEALKLDSGSSFARQGKVINEEKLEALRMQIMEAKRMTLMKKDQVKAEAERQAKASWAIDLCNQRAEELEARINEGVSTRIDLNKEIEDAKEQIYEAMADIQESKNRLRSLLEIQSELSSKLQVSSLAKSRAETQLENAANARTGLVRDIEELRKRRGILQRRIEFCKEKDAIGMAATAYKVNERASSGCREFSAEEIESATDKFSEHTRLKLGGEWTNVYKGRINQNSVAIKMLNLDIDSSLEVFQAKVNLLMNIRHPNIVALIGFCSELRCLVFEYMQNGCVRDILFSRNLIKIM